MIPRPRRRPLERPERLRVQPMLRLAACVLLLAALVFLASRPEAAAPPPGDPDALGRNREAAT